MTSSPPTTPVGAIRITDPRQIASILGDLRILTRLTTRALAAEAHANQGQIATWLNGDRCPNSDSLIRLANAMGYDLALIPREDA